MDEKMLAVESNVPLKKLTLVSSSGSIWQTGILPLQSMRGFCLPKPEHPISQIIVQTANNETLIIDKLDKTSPKQFCKLQVYVEKDKALLQLFLPAQGERQPIIQNRTSQSMCCIL